MPPTLFIYGEGGVGKTYIVKRLLTKMKVRVLHVDCYACVSLCVSVLSVHVFGCFRRFLGAMPA